MTITPSIKRLISRGADAEEIRNEAIKQGMHTLKASAARCVLEGTTSMAEMMKATYEVDK